MDALATTKREIKSTMNLLESWGLTKGLTNSEIAQIGNHLSSIAKAAINDVKNAQSNLGDNLYKQIQ